MVLMRQRWRRRSRARVGTPDAVLWAVLATMSLSRIIDVDDDDVGGVVGEFPFVPPRRLLC
jgi:hypothetical protein